MGRDGDDAEVREGNAGMTICQKLLHGISQETNEEGERQIQSHCLKEGSTKQRWGVVQCLLSHEDFLGLAPEK